MRDARTMKIDTTKSKLMQTMRSSILRELRELPSVHFSRVADSDDIVWRSTKINSDIGVGYSWDDDSWVFVDTAGYVLPFGSIQAAILHAEKWLRKNQTT